MMRTAFLTAFCLILFYPALTAQSLHYYYAPNTLQIPVLREKGDAIIGAGLARTGSYTGVEAQGVYSPIRYGAVMVSFLESGSRQVRNNRQEGAASRFGELGFGAYEAFERGSASLFAGVGQGNVYNAYGGNKYSDFTVRRWFIQPGIAYKNKGFRGGVALRLSRISFPKGASSFDISEDELAAIRKIESDTPLFLPELGLSGGLVLAPFTLAVQMASVFPDVDRGFHFSRFGTSIMLLLDFSEIRKNKKGE